MSRIIAPEELNLLRNFINNGKKEIQQIIQRDPKKRVEIELEGRFTLTQQAFEHLRRELTKYYPTVQPEHIHQTDYRVQNQNNNERISAVPETTIQNGVSVITEKILTIEKKSLGYIRNESQINSQYDIKLAVSLETFVREERKSGAVSPRRSQNVMQRIKDRFRYKIDEGAINIDLTYVVESEMIGNEKKSTVKYEVEVEPNSRSVPGWYSGYALKGNSTMEDMLILFNTRLSMVKRMSQDSILNYTNSERDNLAKYMNNVLSASKYQFRSKNYNDRVKVSLLFAARARNIQRRDFVKDGLIGKYDYTVTYKAKGLRKFFVFYNNCIWLVFPPAEFCLVSRGHNVKELEGTIIDGEDLRPGAGLKPNTINTQHYFSPFDTMIRNGDIRIQKEDHNLRRQSIDVIRKSFENMNNPVDRTVFIIGPTKPFKFVGKTISEFNKNFEVFRSEEEKVIFETDGAMFTPDKAPYNVLDHPYNPYGMKFSRDLREYPETLKWKPWEELTIDLAVIITIRERNLYTYIRNPKNKDDRVPIPFVGTRYNPFNAETQVNWDHPILQSISSGVIIEFGPTRVDGDIVLEPRLIRTDKFYANEETSAGGTWDDINRPVSEETLTGKTFDVMRLFHNQIKRELIGTIPPGADLVDIGSGYGADIDKWSKIHKVLAIEKLETNASQFKFRLDKLKESYGKTNRDSIDPKNVELLICGGEEYEKIIQAAIKHFGWDKSQSSRSSQLPPLCITMMLSLSFFWKSYDMLTNLSRTIKGLTKAYHEAGGIHHVSFCFFTIEGDRTLQFFRTHGEEKEIRLGPSTMSFYPKQTDLQGEGEVHIRMDNSIVKSEEGGDQIEYLVKLSQLWEFTGFKEMYPPIPADKTDYLLTQDELNFSNLYVYGTSIETGLKVMTPDRVEYISNTSTNIPSIPPQITIKTEEDKNIVLPQQTYSFPNGEDTRLVTNVEEKVPIPPLYSLSYEYTTAKGDDVYMEWKWNDNTFYRISTLTEYGSIYHCILKATTPDYQNNPSWFQRYKYVINFRRGMAMSLFSEESYKLIADKTNKIFGNHDNFIQWLAVNSTSEPTYDQLSWLPEVAKINICYLKSTGEKQILSKTSENPNQIFIIVHLSSDGKSELLTQLTSEGLFQTMFNPTHPLISKLLKS